MALRRRSRHREDETFPGFTDVVRIGAGGFSTVFQAREIETNRLVALKILNVHDVSEHALGSFQRETFALGTLSAHPNIVTLYRTLSTEDDRPVLVLELCHGSIWERIRDQGSIAPWESVAVAVKIAGALETAHRAGMLHRDIKPENVLITQYGEPALADFGVARLQSTSQATAGVFGFTTIHAAPELLEGRDLSAATDVYGLASTLYQLIVGKAAFRSFEDEGPASVILRILRDPVQPPVAEGIPVALSDLLVSSMSKNPFDRPASALELADELRAIEAASSWPDTPYAIEETVTFESRTSSRPGRFQVRGVGAPVPDSIDLEPERPAPPVIVTAPAARPHAPAASLDPVSPPLDRGEVDPPSSPQPVSPTPDQAEVDPPSSPQPVSPSPDQAEVDPPSSPQPVSPSPSQHEPDPASETVFMRSGPGRVEVPRGERRVVMPLGRAVPAPPAPIRPTPPISIPQPATPAPPTAAPLRPPPPPPPPPAAPLRPPPPPPPPAPNPIRVAPVTQAEPPIEMVFPLAPDPVPIRPEPELSDAEPQPGWPEPEPLAKPEPVAETQIQPENGLQPEPEPIPIEPVPAAASAAGQSAPPAAEPEAIRTGPFPVEPIQPEPIQSEPVHTWSVQMEPMPPEPAPARAEPEAAPVAPADVPAARLRPTPQFDHLFDEEERRVPTIRPVGPPIGASTAQTAAARSRPRFLSQSFTLDADDESNDRRTRPTPVVKRTTAQAPPIPLRVAPKPTEDPDLWSGPGWARGIDRDITTDGTDDAEDEDQTRKTRRRQKKR